MRAVLFAALAIILPQEKNEAEKLFKKAEEKVAKATSVQVKSTGSAKMGGGEMSVTVEAAWEAGNRARVETIMKLPGIEENSVFISDGAKSSMTNSRRTFTGKPPEKLSEDLGRAWVRGGGLFTATWVDAVTAKDKNHPKREKLPVCIKFKLGPMEKIRGRDVHRIEYTAQVESGDVSSVIWIDFETLLPVKREMRGFHKSVEMTLTETFSEFKFDEKLDESKFEMPNEAK